MFLKQNKLPLLLLPLVAFQKLKFLLLKTPCTLETGVEGIDLDRTWIPSPWGLV